MSEKRNVPTFRVFATENEQPFEGPLTAPDRSRYAASLPDVHEILRSEGALLVYDLGWHYIPAHAVHHVDRGGSRFHLPWPLEDE
jgi:hypothetical protein